MKILPVARPLLLVAAVLQLHGETAAQLTYIGSTPTGCTSFFRPIGGITSHDGYYWDLGWHTAAGQFHFALYTGVPNPVVSEGGRATWTNPRAFVECWIDQFRTTAGQPVYQYRWHVVYYDGDVVGNCETGGLGGEIYITSYDPYDPDGAVETPFCEGGGAGGSTGGSGCGWQYLELEISYDGGVTWWFFWSGWVNVCDEE